MINKYRAQVRHNKLEEMKKRWVRQYFQEGMTAREIVKDTVDRGGKEYTENYIYMEVTRLQSKHQKPIKEVTIRKPAQGLVEL